MKKVTVDKVVYEEDIEKARKKDTNFCRTSFLFLIVKKNWSLEEIKLEQESPYFCPEGWHSLVLKKCWGVYSINNTKLISTNIHNKNGNKSKIFIFFLWA